MQNSQISMLDKDDYVIILHGIARSSNHMKSLATILEKSGFSVINLDYPSTSYNTSST